MELKVILSRGDLVLRAKDETYLAVRTYLSEHKANVDSHYEMQADERDTHERKLLASIPSSLARFKAALYRYTVTDTLEDGKDAFSVTLVVSKRFNGGRDEDIRRMMQEYIYRNMIAEWWTANYPESAGTYANGAQECLEKLRLLLSLSYPAVTHLRKTEVEKDRTGYLVRMTVYRDEVMDGIHSRILSLSNAKRSDAGVPDLDMQTDEFNGTEPLERSVDRFSTAILECLSAYLIDFEDGEETEDTEQSATEETAAVEETDNTDEIPLPPRRTLVYTLHMPPAWKDTLAPHMADYIHDYLVDKAASEYVLSYLPEIAGQYATDGEATRDRLKFILTMRLPGMSRRPLQPF